MSGLEERIADLADGLLEALLLSDRLDDRDQRLQSRVNPWDEDNLWPTDFHILDAICEDLGGSDYLLHDPHEIPAIWPIDLGLALLGNDEHPRIKRGQAMFARYVSLAPVDLRGLTRLVPQRSLAIFQGRIKDGKHAVWRDIWGQVGGGWVWLDQERGGSSVRNFSGGTSQVVTWKSPEDMENSERGIELALAAALTERYQWHVAFGYKEGGARVLIPTSPRGCLELFRSRDKDPGQSRRAALRHWVSSHYRNRSDDPGAFDYVCQHLRGHSHFIWNNLFCELLVSQYDLERNEFFRLQAAEWRAQRRHNRVRLRRKMS